MYPKSELKSFNTIRSRHYSFFFFFLAKWTLYPVVAFYFSFQKSLKDSVSLLASPIYRCRNLSNYLQAYLRIFVKSVLFWHLSFTMIELYRTYRLWNIVDSLHYRYRRLNMHVRSEKLSTESSYCDLSLEYLSESNPTISVIIISLITILKAIFSDVIFY